jgi:hypothetical protein
MGQFKPKMEAPIVTPMVPRIKSLLVITGFLSFMIPPNPDKPELNIDPLAAEILKICGIASGFAFGYDPTGRSVFSI